MFESVSVEIPHPVHRFFFFFFFWMKIHHFCLFKQRYDYVTAHSGMYGSGNGLSVFFVKRV